MRSILITSEHVGVNGFLHDMAEHWGRRLRNKLHEKNWSAADLADAMIAKGFGKDGDTGKARERRKLISNIEAYCKASVGQPRGTMVADIAATLDVSEMWLRQGDDASRYTIDATPVARENLAINPEFVKTPLELRRGVLPIRGRVMMGRDGFLNFSGDDFVGTVEAPPRLADVPGAYAVYVIGNSMEPVLRAGMICCVHPHLPPNKGDDVVVQLTEDDGVTITGLLKRFVSMNDRELKVCQFNPEKVLTFPRRKVYAVHRVMWYGPPF